MAGKKKLLNEHTGGQDQDEVQDGQNPLEPADGLTGGDMGVTLTIF